MVNIYHVGSRDYILCFFFFLLFRVIALLGLLVISVGAGGIKPCVFAFGSDQFQLPQHVKQFQRFIVKFMIAVSIGALATSFATLELRESVLHRFRKNNIYPLAFGVPAALMSIATGKAQL
jgi:solute carrier family 15 oligopeptide transporter 1